MFARLQNVVWPDSVARRFLSILLVLFALQQLLIVIIFPPFSGHDEVAHFDYIRLISQEHRLPEIPELEGWRREVTTGMQPSGDFIRPDLYPYCLFTLEWWPCEPDNPQLAANPPYSTTTEDGEQFPIAWQYAANHPPLYYLMAAPVHRLLDNQGLGVQLRAMRTLSIPFGLLMIAGTFALARQVAPRSSLVPAAAAAFIAFQPQVAYSAAILNNDVTVIATGAWLLALLVYGMRRGFSWRVVAGAGALFGISLLFKGTAIVFTPVIALAVVTGIGWRHGRRWLSRGVAIAAIGLTIASPWYLHMWRTYGSFDALDRVEALQSFWNYPDGAPDFFSLLTDRDFIVRFWRETWGGFGWRRIPVDDGLLWAIGLVCALCMIGLAIECTGIWHARRSPEVEAVGSEATLSGAHIGVLLFAVGVTYLAVVQFGTTFELAQARYAFPAMPAFGVLLAVGLRALVPARFRSYALVGWVAALLALTFYLYTALVIPYWYLGAPR